MADTKTIVCLANSRRSGNYCVAGKEILGDGRYGEWIRPVNSQNYDNAISPEDMQLADGGQPKLLDVISIPLLEHVPEQSHQPENYQIDNSQPWTKQGVLDKQELPALVDEAYDIWRIRRSTKTDRVWESCINEVNQSLLLIRPESLTINASGWKVRANFRYNGEIYNMGVTDPEAESRYAAKEFVEIATDRVYLCLSIAANPFRSSYYKLVAAIIGDTD